MKKETCPGCGKDVCCDSSIIECEHCRGYLSHSEFMHIINNSMFAIPTSYFRYRMRKAKEIEDGWMELDLKADLEE